MVTGKPFRLFNLRANRERPGLRRQHLHALNTVAQLTSSKVEGAKLGSLEVRFYPGRQVKGGSYFIDFQSAGSITLFLQAVLPVCILVNGEITLEVIGGTEVPASPTIDWFRFLYGGFLKRFTDLIKIDVLQRGYYPAGGGRVTVRVRNSYDGILGDLRGIVQFLKSKGSVDLTRRGSLKRIHALSVAHEKLRERKVAQRQVSGALEVLKELNVEVSSYRQYVRSPSIGTSITLWVEDGEGRTFVGADALGEKGKPAEEVGAEAALKILEDWRSGSCVDRHMADHLVPWVALAGGQYTFPLLTDHLKTAVWVAEIFLGKGVLKLSSTSLKSSKDL